MSGVILTQENVTIQIDIGAGFVDFPCVTNFDTGTASTTFEDVSCFSTPTQEPEYAAARLSRSTGSTAYNVATAGEAVHQFLLTANGQTVAIQSVVTFPDATTYTRTQDYLVGGVSEPIPFDGIYVHTVELQPTGAITRVYA